MPEVSVRGYCMTQEIGQSKEYTVDSVQIDIDKTQKDNEGNTPIWLKLDNVA